MRQILIARNTDELNRHAAGLFIDIAKDSIAEIFHQDHTEAFVEVDYACDRQAGSKKEVCYVQITLFGRVERFGIDARDRRLAVPVDAKVLSRGSVRRELLR